MSAGLRRLYTTIMCMFARTALKSSLMQKHLSVAEMAQTWKTEIVCPYCGVDITRKKQKERMEHKQKCDELHRTGFRTAYEVEKDGYYK